MAVGWVLQTTPEKEMKNFEPELICFAICWLDRESSGWHKILYLCQHRILLSVNLFIMSLLGRLNYLRYSISAPPIVTYVESTLRTASPKFNTQKISFLLKTIL
jgi:hypothetical protein